jgi:cbb3-type cytochrome oxidase cytochrome c subunit
VKGLAPLFLGLFGTFAFSWVGLTVIPNIQIGALNPQSDEEGTDTYPMPKSGMAERGQRVYAANGCVYCHSQQVRPDYASADMDRKWGERRSAPRDYLFDRPVVLGQERMGPDLSNVGKRGSPEEEKPAGSPAANAPAPPPAGGNSPPPANSPGQPAPPQNAGAQKPAGGGSPAAAAQPSPATAANPSPSATPNPNGMPPVYSEAWHYRHLYSPRSMSPDNRDSTMPAYRFLFDKRPVSGERSADALQLTGADAPPPGWEVVPSYDAKCLVAYLMSLDQSHPLKEVKSGGGAAPAAASPAAAQPAGSPAAAAPPPGSLPPAPAKK